jgi:cytochrome c biogenesis protein CcdA
VVLTYIALYQTAAQGLLTILVYAIGLSIPLIVISSVGGGLGKAIKDKAKISGELADRVIGAAIIAIGMYFLYLAFW